MGTQTSVFKHKGVGDSTGTGKKRVWLDWAIKTTVENDAKCPVRIFGILPPYPFFAPNFTCNTKVNDYCLISK